MANVRFGYARKIGALLLLLLFTEYLGSTSLFVHSHHVGGHLVVHSHPYSGSSDNPHHSHSAQQCKAISLLSVFHGIGRSRSPYADSLGCSLGYPDRTPYLGHIQSPDHTRLSASAARNNLT